MGYLDARAPLSRFDKWSWRIKRRQKEPMAKSVNKVILLGHVGRNPEIKGTQNGVLVASFSLATTDRVKDQAGNWSDRTEWHQLVAFKRTAELIRDYVKKGAKLYVEGKIQTRSWDDRNTGEKRYRTEIIAYDVSLISGGTGKTEEAPASNYTRDEYSQQSPEHATEITDDDIPF